MNAPFLHEPETFSEENDPFLMGDLPPRDTGLPMVVWIGPGMGVRHDVRVKISMTHGDRLDAGNLATVSVRPEPELLHGALSKADLDLVCAWIALNREAIIDYSDAKDSTLEMAQRIKKLPV